VSRPHGGRVRESLIVKLAPEAIVHLGSHQWDADLQDAHRRWHCHQPNVVLHL
jgi:hypothetical protein